MDETLISEKLVTRISQDEAGYIPLSDVQGEACANCRFFDGAIPACSLIENYPEDITSSGYCTRHELPPQLEPIEDEPTMEQILSVELEKAIAPTPEDVDEDDTEELEHPQYVDYGDQEMTPPTLETEDTTADTVKRLSLLGNVKARLNDAMHRRAKVESTGFKAHNGNWVAWVTNNFEDREGEFFTEKAIDRYIQRVETGLVPYPELWYWHIKGSRHGQAKMLGRIGHFLIAAGSFDDTPAGKAAQKHYASGKKKYAMSHGFTFDPATKAGNVYHDFNTFEVSTLPPRVAANPYTFMQIKETKMLSPEQKAGLAALISPEEADKLIAATDEAGKAIEESGIASKEFAHVDELTTPAAPDETAVKEVTTNLTDLILNMATDQADIAGGLLTVTKAHRVLESSVDDRIAAFEARIKAQDETIAALKALVEDRPRVASQAVETVVTAAQVKDMGITVNSNMIKHPFWGTEVPENSITLPTSDTLK